MPFLSLVTLTFDLDTQTRPSEGPNTSFVWIWRKSVQNLPPFTACHKKERNPYATKGKSGAREGQKENGGDCWIFEIFIV